MFELCVPVCVCVPVPNTPIHTTAVHTEGGPWSWPQLLCVSLLTHYVWQAPPLMLSCCLLCVAPPPPPQYKHSHNVYGGSNVHSCRASENLHRVSVSLLLPTMTMLKHFENLSVLCRTCSWYYVQSTAAQKLRLPLDITLNFCLGLGRCIYVDAKNLHWLTDQNKKWQQCVAAACSRSRTSQRKVL